MSLTAHSFPDIILEDNVICQDCLKNDVCLIFRGVAEAHIQYLQSLSVIEEQFGIELNIVTSIEKCKFMIAKEIRIIER